MKKQITLLMLTILIFSTALSVKAQIYLTEDFEAAWTGTPAAPPGWAQTRFVLIGDGIPDGGTSGEKDWTPNTWTGSAWSFVAPSFPGSQPIGAQSGTGVAYFENANTSSLVGSRRLESPVMDLSASTTPYVRFYEFLNSAATAINFKVVASADGGATWNSIMIVPASIDSVTAKATGVTPNSLLWQKINVLIPAAYRTANCKIGIEMIGDFGTNNLYVDNLVVEEFAPESPLTTITSAGTGNWNTPATWTGGVVPKSDNNVIIAAGHTVTVDINIARMQNLTVDGTLTHDATTSHLVHVMGNLTINAGGTYNSNTGAAGGRRTYIGGSFSNAGTANFGLATSAIVWTGGSAATYSSTGTMTNGRIAGGIIHLNSGGVTYNSPINTAGTISLYTGAVNPNGNLSLGVAAVSTTQIIERTSGGSFTSAPVWNDSVNKSNTYTTNISQMLTKTTIMTGEEIQLFGGVRTVRATLLMSTYDHVQLSTPVTVGTATTGVLTMTRGILLTSDANLLTLSPFVAGSAGTTPSTATPPTTSGSYVFGPMRINFPSTGLTTRNYPLGLGTGFNSPTPNSNTLRTVSFGRGSGTWGSQTVTVRIAGTPSGVVSGGDPSNLIASVRSYYVDLNTGPDFDAVTTITLNGNNYTNGGSVNNDSLKGDLSNLRIGQSTALTGPWSSRSIPTGTGNPVDNTVYPRTSATAAPGPIAPILTNGGYFTWLTLIANQVYDSTNIARVTSDVAAGTSNAEVTQIKVNATGGLSPLPVTKINCNTAGTLSALSNIDSAKIFFTGSSAVYTTGTQYGSTIINPGGLISFTGSQSLAAGANYFWLAYYVKSTAPAGNYVNGECDSLVVDGVQRFPVSVPPLGLGRRIIQTNNGSDSGYYYANNLATDQVSYPAWCWKDTTGSKNYVLNGVLSQTNIGGLDDGYWKKSIRDAMLECNQDTSVFKKIKYNGVLYDSFFVCTNGIIGFTEAYGATSISDFNVDGAQVAKSAILPFWHDANFANLQGGTNRLSYKIKQNQLIVTYDRVVSFAPTTDWVSYQVVIELVKGAGDDNSNWRVSFAGEANGNTSASFIDNYLAQYNAVPPAVTTFRNYVLGYSNNGAPSAYAGYVSSANPFPATPVTQLNIKRPLYSIGRAGLAIEFGPDQNSLNEHDCLTLCVALSLEGLQSGSRVRDTVDIIIRDCLTPPYKVMQVERVYLDSTHNGSYAYGIYYIEISMLKRGHPVYIVIGHRNSIKSWSQSSSTMNDTMYYNFTSGVGQTYGSNSVLVNGAASFYSGDITQDGVIDGSDGSIIDNDAANFTTGDYVLSDLNWDGVVDGSDGLFTDNNSANFIAEIKPPGASAYSELPVINYNHKAPTEVIVIPDPLAQPKIDLNAVQQK